jgi:hypothetical protein
VSERRIVVDRSHDFHHFFIGQGGNEIDSGLFEPGDDHGGVLFGSHNNYFPRQIFL